MRGAAVTLLAAALACAPVSVPPPGVAVIGGVCGGAIVGGRAITAAHCVDRAATDMIPVLTTTGLQGGDLTAIIDGRGEDIAWVWLVHDPGPSIEPGAAPVRGQEVSVWLASRAEWADATVLAVDHDWSRARLSVEGRRGDSGSPVIDSIGRLRCLVTGRGRDGEAVCSWGAL